MRVRGRIPLVMNSLFLFAAILLVILPVGGCGNTASQPAAGGVRAQKQTVIATSFYPMYIATMNVAKDIPGVTVVNLTEPTTGCLHEYQLTTNDLKRLQDATILVVNGAGMESFLDKAIAQQPNLKIVEASRGIKLIKNENGQDNPHVWVSVSLAMQQVKNISEQLAVLDPSHAGVYRSNAASYLQKLQALKNRMHAGLQGASQKDIITFHEAFPYFAKEFDLRIAAVVEREPGSEPSAAELADSIALIKSTKIPAIFTEPQYPSKAAETIARETNARVYVLDPAVTGPEDTDGYINIMENNLETLQEALNSKS